MNLAIKQPWFSKKFKNTFDVENITVQPLLFFKKPYFIDDKIIMAIELNKNYLNDIKQQKRQINENIFKDYDCSEYKYPELVKKHLKNDYVLNVIFNKIIDKENHQYQQLYNSLNKQEIKFLKLYL